MKQIKSILLLLMVALSPLQLYADNKEEGELNIPEIVLEHLSDSYEWHIASYKGRHLSLPLPIIVRSSATGEWHFCTVHSLPQGFYFDGAHHGLSLIHI